MYRWIDIDHTCVQMSHMCTDVTHVYRWIDRDDSSCRTAHVVEMTGHVVTKQAREG